jgi:hypothetical protein
MRQRGWALAAAAVLTVACTLPSCDSTNDVDRRRADVLRDEPLFRGLDPPAKVEVGWATAGPHDWRRPNAHGTLAAWPPPTDPAAAARDGRARAAEALKALRDNGWVVMWTRCTGTTWQALGYRIHDGASLGFELRGEATPGGTGGLYLYLVAPHHFDPDDLVPDRPAGRAAADTCVERPDEPTGTEEQGNYLKIEQHHVAKPANPNPSVR